MSPASLSATPLSSISLKPTRRWLLTRRSGTRSRRTDDAAQRALSPTAVVTWVREQNPYGLKTAALVRQVWVALAVIREVKLILSFDRSDEAWAVADALLAVLPIVAVENGVVRALRRTIVHAGRGKKAAQKKRAAAQEKLAPYAARLVVLREKLSKRGAAAELVRETFPLADAKTQARLRERFRKAVLIGARH